MNFHNQKSLNTTTFHDITSSFSFSHRNEEKVSSPEMSQNGFFSILTWMSLADRLGCEQETCVVFHLVAVVNVISIGVTVWLCFGHFYELLIPFISLRTSRELF